MSVENTETNDGTDNGVKHVNGIQEQQRINGLSNGHIIEDSNNSKHKSSSKDKHRDKERDKDYKSSKSSSSRDKESDKHKSSSSSSKDKYRDKDRDKDKHKSSSSSHKSSRDKDKEREREREKDKEKERSKERDRDKDKERHRDKDKERSKEKSDRDYEKRDRESDREKEKKKEHKSSSKGKERDKEKSDSTNKDKDRDRHKSSKDKHSSSSSKSKDKDKSKDRHLSSRDKDRHRDKDKKDRVVVNADNVENGKGQYDDIKDTKNVKDVKDIKDVKVELDTPRNDYDQSCSGFPAKDEYDNKYREKPGYEAKPEVKDESCFNYSQASSCDYSMSQFREDEPPFEIKGDMTDDSQGNVENDTFGSGAQEEDGQDGGDEEMQDYSQEEDEYVPEDEEDEEDIPLAKRKAAPVEESDDDIPLVNRKKQKTDKKEKKEKKAKKKKREEADDDFLDEKPKKKKTKKEKTDTKNTSINESPTKGRKKKEEEPEEVWRWWEEEKREDGVKWTFLEHKGPVFAPEYEPLPKNVNFYYDGKPIRLSLDAEEIACFYAKMLNHDYVTKKIFNDNFFKDWRKSMTSRERDLIRDLSKCNFNEMHEYFLAISEKNKSRTKEEKQAIKEANEKLIQEYGYCKIDGHKERIGNFKLEPPGLFRGRGEHPKMGMVKKRIMPEEVSINCSKDSKIPQPPAGHKWKEIRHDNTVTWLASWVENIQGQVKYIMLNPSSKLKGEKDFQKYEVARRLDKHIDKIRAAYRDEWKSKEMRIRQRGVALYFIDKLALRAGNEKDEDQADTVGCCSLRVEHVQLHKELNGRENVVIFDFLGKDSIRYYNEVEVEKRVFKNLELFMENKKDGDDLFDRLNTAVLNEHLRELMEGLTAKVFRTYNASITLQNQLDLLTDPNVSIPEKLLAYNRANRAVAVLCNHQRSVPKSHAKSMENLKEKIRVKREQIDNAEAELKDLRRQAKRGSVKEKLNADKKSKQLDKLKEQLKKLELQETDRDENKTIALGTSKLNYLDPRITVAWCKKYGVPIEKIFNKTHREKFRWAIHMADENYRF